METLNLCVSSFSLRHGGGADLAAWGQALELSKYHNVSVLCDNSTDTSTGRLIERENGIRFFKYRIKPRTLLGVAREVGKLGFDVISSHTAPMDLVAVYGGVPHVLHDYGLPSLGVTLRYESLKYWGITNTSRLISVLHPMTRLVLPSSTYIARDLKWFTRHDKPTYILHSGIRFPVDDEMGPPPVECPYVLFVGRHVRYKRVDHLIRLFARVRERVPNVHLVTVGLRYDWFYDSILRGMAERVGNVHLLGYVDDVWPFYKYANVYASCSLYEGEDRPALEAQSLGVPVVSFDNYSHPEVVKHGYCAVGDDDFVDALCHYLGGMEREMGVARHIRKEYGIESVVWRYNHLIKGVV